MSHEVGSASEVPDRVLGTRRFGAGLGPARLIGLGAVSLLLLSLAAYAGYHQLFSSFAWWDDEGYLMVSLRTFMEGHPLYDATYSQYGPAYYLLYASVHKLAHLPITNDVVRLTTLAEWLAISLGALFIVRRLTRSWLFAAFAFILTFLHLDRLSLEPGHPQGLAALLVVAVLLLGTWAPRGASRRVGFGMGVAVGILLLTKINVGVLVLLAASAAMTTADRTVTGFFEASSSPDTAGRKPIAILLANLPVFALLGLFGYAAAVVFAPGWSWRGLLLPVVVAGGLAGVVAGGGLANRVRNGDVSRRGLGSFAVGCFLVLALLTGITLWQGTSPEGLVEGLFLEPLRLDRSPYRPTSLVPLALPCALLPVPLALAAARGRVGIVVVGRVLLLMLVTAVVVGYVMPTTVPIGDAFRDRGYPALIVSVAPLLAWVLLFGDVGLSAGHRPRRAVHLSFARSLLVLVAVTLPLIAYPIPGSQMAVGSFPLLLVGSVAASDFVRLDLSVRTRTSPLGVLTAGLLLFLSVGSLAIRATHVSSRRASLMPLGLPGATRLRLPEGVVEEYRWIVSNLRARCDTFIFGRQTRSSFYFWTRLEPPTAWNATRWEGLLDEQQQRRTVEALKGYERPCVVWGDRRRWEAASEDAPRAAPDRGRTADHGLPETTRVVPLWAYIEERFEPAWEHGSFQVWALKGRAPAQAFP